MKLNRLQACFGRLQNETLELKGGLNLIEAPNEAGKSTWAAFLRAMLYGIDTKERDKKGVIAEKNRFQPWSGSIMEGSMDLTWGGREITLRRSGKSSAPFSRFQAVYTGTEEPVPGLTADTVGELLTGVGRSAFERSAFIGQDAMAVTDSAELERRVSAIVSTGQEEVSYSEIEGRLREWKNRRQSNQRTGLIPRLEEEYAACQETLRQLEGANRQQADLRAEVYALEQERRSLEEQIQAARAAAVEQQQQRYDAAAAELEQAQANLEAVRKERRRRGIPPDREALRRMQGELSYLNTLEANIKQARREQEEAPPLTVEIDHPVFSGMEPGAAREAARNHAEIAGKLNSLSSKLLLPIFLLFGLALFCLVLTIFRHLWMVLLPAAVCAGGGIAVVLLFLARKKAVAEAERVLTLYGADSGEEILRQAEEYTARWDAAAQARTEAAVRVVTMERLLAEREELTERLLAAVHPFAPEIRDLFGVSAAISLALQLEERERAALQQLESTQKVWQAVSAQGTPGGGSLTGTGPLEPRLAQVKENLEQKKQSLARLQGEMNAFGDPAALEARLSQLGEEIDRRRREHKALTLAMSTLEEANAQLRERMSPALNARAGELFHRLTGGAYSQVSLNRQFQAMAARPEDVTPRRLLELSKGTADQLYLAVRLALCELVFPGGDPPPLILDDALLRFDDRRLALALDLLRELAQRRQILLFTCQSRERLALAGAEDVAFIR